MAGSFSATTRFPTFTTFGEMLKYLRRRARMTQGELSIAVGYSISQISRLEQNERFPDQSTLLAVFVPALNLQDEPQLATRLVELAAMARNELLPHLPRQLATAQPANRTDQPRNAEKDASAQLPMTPTGLVGRQQELKNLIQRFVEQQARLVTLLGPPGVGKTRLALEAIRQLRSFFRDGAVFVPLAAINDPILMASTIAAAVGSNDFSPKPPQTRLIEFLRHKTMLLVLDNLEQIGEAAPVVATLIAECPGLSILATSRERLHLRAEQRCKVLPLDLAPAIELFVQRAQAVDADFHFAAHHQPTLEAICQRLDCLPLALEVCAAQLDLFSPTQLLAQLQDHRLDLLVAGAVDLPPRQRTLRTAMEHSYRLLNELERTLFRALGIFVDGFDLAAVRHLGFDTEILHGLINKSLVHLVARPIPTTPNGELERRFMLLEVIREYAHDQLTVANETAKLHRLHADYFLNLAATAAQYMERREKQSWLERLQGDYGNLRAALTWLIATDALAAQHMARLLWRFWEASALQSEGRTWLAKALAANTAPTPPRAWALWAKAHLTDMNVDFQHAHELAQESLTIFQALADPVGCCEALILMGYIFMNAGQGAQALPYLEQALELARQAGQPQCLAHALVALGDVYLQLGHSPTQILPLLEESAQIYDELSDLQGLAYTMHVKARTHMLIGDYQQGIVLGQEALAIFRAIGSPLDIAWVSTTLGGASWFGGDGVGACGYWEAAQQFFQAAGDHGGLKEVWYGFAMAAGYLLKVTDVMFTRHAFEHTTRLLSVVQKIIDNQPPFLDAVAREKYREMLATLRHDYLEGAFDALWAAGHQLALAEAVAFALTLPDAPVVVATPPWALSSPALAPQTYQAGLTEREVEVLRLVAQRLTYPQIAEKLMISRRTVNAHVTAIYSKLGVNERETAIRLAIERHLL